MMCLLACKDSQFVINWKKKMPFHDFVPSCIVPTCFRIKLDQTEDQLKINCKSLYRACHWRNLFSYDQCFSKKSIGCIFESLSQNVLERGDMVEEERPGG